MSLYHISTIDRTVLYVKAMHNTITCIKFIFQKVVSDIFINYNPHCLMGSDMHSVPKLPFCYTVLWQILQVHICITKNSNYKKNSRFSFITNRVWPHKYLCQVSWYSRLWNSQLCNFNREPKWDWNICDYVLETKKL